jgi:hypothetical protein
LIYRYGVECPGCHARLLLRVSVGADIEQPFFVVCGQCQTVIKGKQVIWYEPHPGARLDMESATLIDPREENFVETISVNPELPARRSATEMSDEGGSSFLHNAQLLGPSLVETMRRIGLFRNIVSEDGAGLRRLGTFYLNGDWPRFQEEGRRLFGKNWPEPKKDWQYHDVLARVFLMAYHPLMIGDLFPRFVEEWNRFLSSNKAALPAQRAFAESMLTSGQISELQRLVLERFDFMATHKAGLLAALPAEFYEKGMEAAVAELRLPRDDFDVLKGHYVDCYELAHQVLTIIVGTVNVIERGSHDTFDPSICAALAAKGMNNFKNLPSLDAFGERPNGPKRAFLKSLPVCHELWDAMLERDLRNAVGHYGARHDLRSGMILVDGKPHCSYLEFVVKTIRLTHVLLALLHVLKMCHMQKLLTDAVPAAAAAPAKGPPKNRFKKRKPKR